MPSLERWPVVEGGALVLVGALCLYFQLSLPGKLPSEADYRSMQQVLERDAQPGDALLLAPWWAERARVFAPASVTVVGYQGSDSDDLKQHPRVWVLSQPELPRAAFSDFSKAFLPNRSPLGEARQFGPLQLQLFHNGRAKPVQFSSMQALSQATVALEQPNGQRQACQWSGRSFRCPNGHEVAVEWHEVRFQPRRCLRFDAPGGQTKLIAEFVDAPQTDELQLTAGFIWDRGWFHDDAITATDFGVEVDGQPVTSLTIPAGLEGLQRATAKGTRAGATIKLWMRSASPRLREACVELYGYGANAPGASR